MPCWLKALLGACLTLALLPGCSDRQAIGPPSDPGDRRSLRRVSLPDLSRMSESVRQQIRDEYSALTLAIENPRTPAADLGNAYGRMGNLFTAARYFDAAESCYLNALALAPDEVRWPYYLAHMYRTNSDSVRAAEFFERFLQLQPTDVAALVYLGDEYLALGRPDAAEPPLSKAVSLEPRLALALFALGRVALAKQDYAGAVRYIERALELEPQASTARYPLAMAYRGLGDRNKAEAHLRDRGSARFQFLPDPLMLEIQLLLASADAYSYQGSEALANGEWALAAKYFRKGVELAPRDPSLRLKLAEALRRSGLAEESLRHYAQAVAIAPRAEAAAGQFGYAMAFARLGRYPEARDRLIEGMKAHPDRPAFSEALVRLLAAAPDDRVRDGRRALAMTREMIEQRPTPNLYETMAMALAEVGQFDQAAALQRELIAAAARTGHDDLVHGLTSNLRRYEARQPCRVPWNDADMP